MSFVEILKVIVLGLVEGFTEWLPISSTGHMILVNELIHLNQPDSYYEVFEVVIQLGLSRGRKTEASAYSHRRLISG